jgi:hypothetical protein
VSATSNTQTITETNLILSSFGDRMQSASRMWMYWRPIKLRLKQILQVGVNSSTITLAESYVHALAFNPLTSTNTTAPTDIEAISDYPEFSHMNGKYPIVLRVARNGLIGSQPVKWLQTNNVADADEQSAGTITSVSITGGASDSSLVARLRLLIEYEMEFKGPVDPDVIPLDLRILREKQELQKLLELKHRVEEKKIEQDFEKVESENKHDVANLAIGSLKTDSSLSMLPLSRGATQRSFSDLSIVRKTLDKSPLR